MRHLISYLRRKVRAAPVSGGQSDAGSDRDMGLLICLFAILLVTLITSVIVVREGERHLLKTETEDTAVYWAKLLESQISHLDDMLVAGLVSEDDRAALDFARLAGRIRDYQIIRPDGVVAVSSWSGDFRDILPADMLAQVVNGGVTHSEVITGPSGADDQVIARAYVPLSTNTGRRGAIKVDIDVTELARNHREISNAGLAVLVMILLLAGGGCAFFILRNMSARRLSERLQLERSSILEDLAKGADLSAVLRRIAAVGEIICEDEACIVVMLDPEGRTVSGVVGSSGALMPELVGRSITDLPDMLSQAFRSSRLWSRSSTFGVLQLDVPLRANSGAILGLLRFRSRKHRLYHAAATAMALSLGQLTALAVEYRRSELALNDIRQRHEIILSSAADGIFGVDSNGCISFANPAAARLLQRALTFMVGREAGELIYSPKAIPVPCPITATLQDGRSRQVEQLNLRRSDGTTFIADMVVSPVMRKTSGLRAVAVFHDVTAQIEAQHQLRHAKEEAELASSAKSNFLANMSHELRTPLNAIIGFSEMMQREVLGPLRSSKYHAYADDIHQSGRHLLSLINDLLDLSKIEAGKLELEDHAVDLKPLIGDCLLFVRDAATAEGVTLEASVALEVACVRADEQKLKQIITNLLSNAVKFTPQGGLIKVSARLAGDNDLELVISDTGIGIPPDEMDKVMSRFEQATFGLDRRRSGTGLGLPLASALAELHGGKLKLASTLGVGTTASVVLPGRVLQPSRRRPTALVSTG